MYPFGLDYDKITESSTNDVLDFISFLKKNYKSAKPIADFLSNKFGDKYPGLRGFFKNSLFIAYGNLNVGERLQSNEILDELYNRSKKVYNGKYKFVDDSVFNIDYKAKLHFVIVDKLCYNFKKVFDIENELDVFLQNAHTYFLKQETRNLQDEIEDDLDDDIDNYFDEDDEDNKYFNKLTEVNNHVNEQVRKLGLKVKSERYYCIIFLISKNPKFSTKIVVPISVIKNKSDLNNFINTLVLTRNIEFKIK